MYRLNRTICEVEVLCSLLSPRARLTKIPKPSRIKGLNKARTLRDSAWNATRFGEANQYITASKSFKSLCWMCVRSTMANIARIQGISVLRHQHEYKGHKSNLQEKTVTRATIGHATKTFKNNRGSLRRVRLYAANALGEGAS